MKNKHNAKVVAELPAPRRVSKYKINWDDYAETARLLGQPVLAGRHIKESQAKAIRLYNRPPFVTPEGRIRVHLRDSQVEDGVRYGDVYLTWEPATPKEEK